MADTLGGDLQAALAGAFTIERELGGGGMSRVFLATDQALGRRVVIKVVAPELARGVSADRFRREIQVAAGLQHPHIVPVFSAGEALVPAGSLLYYTMPYVTGESLRARHLRPDMVVSLRHGRATRDAGHLGDLLACVHPRRQRE